MKKFFIFLIGGCLIFSTPVYAQEQEISELEVEYEINEKEIEFLQEQVSYQREIVSKISRNTLMNKGEKMTLISLKSSAQTEIKKLEKKIDELKSKNKEIFNTISIAERRANGTLIRDGSFIWPCDSTYITSEFGEWRGYSHCGLDIADSTGSPVYASKNGYVVAAGYDGGMGYHVIIDHGDGVKSIYMHASKLYVTVGQYVEQGQTIMAVGSTGDSTGPHLHFSITINGQYVNPRG